MCRYISCCICWCYYMLIIFFSGIYVRLFKFREDFYLLVFNFAIFLQSRKTRNLNLALSYPMNPYALRTCAVGVSCHVLYRLEVKYCWVLCVRYTISWYITNYKFLVHYTHLACEQQTHFRSSLLRKCVCCSQAISYPDVNLSYAEPLAVGNLGTRLSDCKRKSVLLSSFFFSDHIFHSDRSIPWTGGKFFVSK